MATLLVMVYRLDVLYGVSVDHCVRSVVVGFLHAHVKRSRGRTLQARRDALYLHNQY